MGVYAWRKRTTRHFGTRPVPFADVHIADTHGRMRRFSLQVDTGAVISLMRASAARVLGFDPTGGERIDLKSVGGGVNPVYVHKVWVQFEGAPPSITPIAFSNTEDVPNLLGRLDVMDRWQIGLDPSLHETWILPAWLDDDERRIWLQVLSTERHILQHWSTHSLPGRLDEAARRVLNRADSLIGAAAGLAKLHREWAMPLVLRSLFELSVQFEYIMKDQSEVRAAMFLDYEHVTKYRSEQAHLRAHGALGDEIRSSPLRAAGELANKREYDRVRSAYERPADGTVRNQWHQQQVKQLAAEVGRAAEYDTFYSLYSAFSHNDPWTTDHALVAPGTGLFHAYTYWARILRLIADKKQIVLTFEQLQSIDSLARGMIDKDPEN